MTKCYTKSYQQAYVNKRLFYDQDSGEVVITQNEYNSADYVSKITNLVYRIALSNRVDDRYLLRKFDLTKSFLEILKNYFNDIERNINYIDPFYSHLGFAFINGHNGYTFVFFGNDKFKKWKINLSSRYVRNKISGLPIHDLNPYFEAFFNAAQKTFFPALDESSPLRLLVAKYQNDPDLPAEFKEKLPSNASVKTLLKLIKDETISKEFKNKRNDFNRLPNKNYRNVIDYVGALYKQYSRLWLIRLELGNKLSITNLKNVELNYTKAKESREKLFDDYHFKRLRKQMVGFVWKLELGLDKGFFYQMLFFFDGANAISAVDIGHTIGKMWNRINADNNSTYHNYNALPTGSVSLVDSCVKSDRESLEKIIENTIKPDLYSRVNIRCFKTKGNYDKLFSKGGVKDKK